jgi:hypothetical protein
MLDGRQPLFYQRRALGFKRRDARWPGARVPGSPSLSRRAGAVRWRRLSPLAGPATMPGDDGAWLSSGLPCKVADMVLASCLSDGQDSIAVRFGLQSPADGSSLPGWALSGGEPRSLTRVTGSLITRARCPSLESKVPITREQGAHHSRARCPSLESKVPITREQGAHHSRARCPSLESKVPVTREQGAHHTRARCPSLESQVPITREQGAHHSRQVSLSPASRPDRPP